LSLVGLWSGNRVAAAASSVPSLAMVNFATLSVAGPRRVCFLLFMCSCFCHSSEWKLLSLTALKFFFNCCGCAAKIVVVVYKLGYISVIFSISLVSIFSSYHSEYRLFMPKLISIPYCL